MDGDVKNGGSEARGLGHFVESVISNQIGFLEDLYHELILTEGNTADLKKDLVGKVRKKISMLEQLKRQVANDLINNKELDSFRLKQPNLSDTEVKICWLWRIGLDTFRIGQIMEMTVESVRTTKSRIRKKMGVIKGENMINHLVTEFQ